MNVQEWPIKKVKLSDLMPWSRNPRKISKEAYTRLKNRIVARGFHDILKIDTDNTVLSGNQRLNILKELGVKEVFCKVAPKKLSEKEREVIALESNKNDGVDDWDELAKFDFSTLKESGFMEEEIKLNLADIPGVFENNATKEKGKKIIKIEVPPKVWLLQQEEIKAEIEKICSAYGLTFM